MVLYGIKTCSTCKKALKALKDAGKDATLHDVRENPLDILQLARFHGQVGDGLLNKKSKSWRELSDSEKEGLPLNLIEANPLLMKRPVIEDGETYHLGWTKEVQGALGV